MILIGVDVGGTNTDAVLLEQGQVKTAIKTPTTHDVTTGIRAALAGVTRDHLALARAASAVTIGTTHFINAVVQRRGLNRAAAIRVCLPACASLPPFVDWPRDLATVVNGGTYLVGGGHEYDGRAIAPLDEPAVAAAARRIRADGVGSVGITSVFSPLSDEHERRALEIVCNEHPDAVITLSSEIGRIGLLERENATLLNAALIGLAAEASDAFAQALSVSGIEAPLFITQNDGTVAPVERARRYPVFSFASGPTNSMRGAAHLSGIQDGSICDVGGTTTDVGSIRHGFPREANNVIEIGGVRTLFRMPDVLSIALGGGTVVEPYPRGVSAPALRIGPHSVGHRLGQEALVFGGSVCTCTDIAVAAGLTGIGNARWVAAMDKDYAGEVLRIVHERLEESVDRMKVDAAEVPLVAVGGAAMLVPELMPGISEVVRVEHHDVANAVGAAIAEVSGEVDRVYRDVDREDALADALLRASARAVDAGAAPGSLRTVDVEDLPLAYLPGNALRVRVRVVGGFEDVSRGG